MIKMYFGEDEKAQQKVKDDQNKKNCLVRIYFEKRESVK